eukprot:1157239-Pelagomonas_calceolata.AAC.2
MRLRAASAARLSAADSCACCRALRSFTAVRSARRRRRASCICARSCTHVMPVCNTKFVPSMQIFKARRSSQVVSIALLRRLSIFRYAQAQPGSTRPVELPCICCAHGLTKHWTVLASSELASGQQMSMNDKNSFRTALHACPLPTPPACLGTPHS